MDDFRDFIDYIADVECDDVQAVGNGRDVCEEEQHPGEKEEFGGKISEVIEKIRQSGDESALQSMKDLLGRFVEDLKSLADGEQSEESETEVDVERFE